MLKPILGLWVSRSIYLVILPSLFSFGYVLFLCYLFCLCLVLILFFHFFYSLCRHSSSSFTCSPCFTCHSCISQQSLQPFCFTSLTGWALHVIHTRSSFSCVSLCPSSLLLPFCFVVFKFLAVFLCKVIVRKLTSMSFNTNQSIPVRFIFIQLIKRYCYSYFDAFLPHSVIT